MVEPRANSLPQVLSRHADPHSYPSGVAFIDSQYLPMSEAKISVLD
jgi:branched-chain amino acid aminotransferase